VRRLHEPVSGTRGSERLLSVEEGEWMNRAIDLKREFIAAKAKEDIVGFAGFRLSVHESDHLLEGNLVISSRKREDGSGYITATFLIDAEDDPPTSSAIAALFKTIKQTGSIAGLGRQFESMIETPIELEKSDDWFMDSFTFFANPLSNIKRQDVENKLLPAFETLLPIKFDPMEWLPEDGATRVSPMPEPKAEKPTRSFAERLKSWFGSA
jgi:hypothetical protein